MIYDNAVNTTEKVDSEGAKIIYQPSVSYKPVSYTLMSCDNLVIDNIIKKIHTSKTLIGRANSIVSNLSYSKVFHDIIGRKLKKTTVIVPVTTYEFESKRIVSGRIN